MKRIISILLALLMLAPLCACTQTKSMIEWVDFIRWNDTNFENANVSVPQASIGEKLGEVTGNPPSEVVGKSYETKNGEAPYLEIGTEFFEINGYDSAVYIAACTDGVYTLYKIHDAETPDFGLSSELAFTDVRYFGVLYQSLFEHESEVRLFAAAEELQAYIGSALSKLEDAGKAEEIRRAAEDYDGDYFAENDLISVYVTAPSISMTYELASIVNNTVDASAVTTINLVRHSPETFANAVGHWLIFVELPKYDLIYGDFELNVITEEESSAAKPSDEEPESPAEADGIELPTIDFEKISLAVKPETVTPTGATVVFTDKNTPPYFGYGEWYELEKKSGGKWEALPVIIEGEPVFIEIAYQPNEDGILEMKVNWEWLYGSLEPGDYRVVKNVSGQKYYAEFTI